MLSMPLVLPDLLLLSLIISLILLVGDQVSPALTRGLLLGRRISLLRSTCYVGVFRVGVVMRTTEPLEEPIRVTVRVFTRSVSSFVLVI